MTLWPENELERSKVATGYQPLSSVWDGEDSDLLKEMLSFYPRNPPTRILDATVNTARFWKGSYRPVIGLDVEWGHRPDIVGDNRCMPFADASFDVVVYDPPHVPNQGKDKSKDFNSRFGLIIKSPAANGYNFTHLYPPFLKEAFAGYASVVSHRGFGAAFVVAARDLSELCQLMTAPRQLDTAGHQRFSGALLSQGPGADSLRTAPQALILMGDWCVPATARH